MVTLNNRFPAILMAVLICGPVAHAKPKHAKQAASKSDDQIAIAGHVPVEKGPVTGFIISRYHNRTYAYAERAGSAPIVIDITKPDSPTTVAELEQPANSNSDDLVSVAGTVVLASDAQAAPKPPEALRIIDYSDPAHPKVTREFDGVTAVKSQNGVILLANGEGIWILTQKIAADADEEERYARKVVYGESRY